MKTLTLNGKNLPVKLTTAAILAFEAERKKNLIELFQDAQAGKWSFADIYCLAFHALREGGRLINQPFTATWEEFLDLAEGVSFKELTLVVVDAISTKLQVELPEKPVDPGN